MNEPVEIERRHPFRTADVMLRYHHQGGRCALCPTSIARDFVKDHRVPRAMGGKTNYANLQLICLACAAKKDPADISAIAKAKRMGAPRKVSDRPIQNRGFDRSLRRHMDGSVEPRE